MTNDVMNGHYIQARMNVADKRAAKSGLLGFGIVIIENSIVIKNVRLYQGEKGCFVSFPQRGTDHGYRPYVTCDEKLLNEIRLAVMWEYAYQTTGHVTVEGITIRPARPDEGALAYADVTLTMGLTINGIKIAAGQNGPAIAMPQYNGKDLIYPLGSENRKKLNREILNEYRALQK